MRRRVAAISVYNTLVSNQNNRITYQVGIYRNFWGRRYNYATRGEYSSIDGFTKRRYLST